MALPRLYLSPPHLGGHELNYVAKALADGWVAPAGPHLPAFEAELAAALTSAKHPVPHVVALSSGTAALHVALRLVGVGAGDEVICPTFTFVATANPIVYQGATPVFVDSEAQTWNMCPDSLREALIDRRRKGKRVAAIIVVHLYGMPARLPELLAVAEEFGVPVIEDAAEALGATLHGRPLGTWAPLGIISFNGNKIITTSGGGALIAPRKGHPAPALYLPTQAQGPA
ncbi:MAG: aminotransferase class I/II-fold pyridoxal phosphate-dependent enzyme, partial [Hymenobacteraceae bacterium]|nr:aminotransferase class I/II-fold pyridoxal phosphate-dependent enzyme [Hymenobacteraceae bacterium]